MELTEDERLWLEEFRTMGEVEAEVEAEERAERLALANTAWAVPLLLRPGRDERALLFVLRVGRRLRRLLGLER